MMVELQQQIVELVKYDSTKFLAAFAGISIIIMVNMKLL